MYPIGSTEFQINGFPHSSVDKGRNALISTTLEKHEVELGQMYTAYYKGTIAAGQTLYLAYKTPVDKEIRAYPTVIESSADNLTFKYYEAAAITGGTLATAVNKNRNSDKVSEMVLTATPTVTNIGLQIAQVFLPGSTGVGQSRSGASAAGGDTYWPLKKDTVYILAFENGSTAANTVQITEAWLEI